MKPFRLIVVRFSVLLTALGALVAAGTIDRVAAQGFLMGGLASTVAFWIHARATEKNLRDVEEEEEEKGVAIANKNRLMFSASIWLALRMALYGAAIYKGYTLDLVHMHGCWGAVAGLFVVRVVVSVLAVSGWDLKEVP